MEMKSADLCSIIEIAAGDLVENIFVACGDLYYTATFLI